jgi:hypothetical protein
MKNPLTKYAMNILYNVFCFIVIGIIAFCLCIDWGKVFYP